MDRKCIGCGAVLQHINEFEEGYITKVDGNLCERCFRIKNYGDYKNVIKDNSTFINILKKINKEDLVVLVMDLFNLPKNLDLIKDNITNNMLIVLTKRDILPKVIYEEKLLNYVKKYNINFVDTIIVSSNKNYNFDLLIEKIKKHKTTDRVYIVGYTNAGKSTLINKLIYNYSNNIPSITTSMLPSTTLNSIEIKFDDNTTFVDTPGLLNMGSMENYVSIDTLKKINPKVPIKPLTYQVRTKQFIFVDNILKLELANNNITIFMSNSLNIDRFYKDKDTNLEEHYITINSDEDLVIPGLGFVKFTKHEQVKLSTLKGVEVYTRKSLI